MFLQNYSMGVEEFLHEAAFLITRRAWTRKFDENLKQDWSDEDEDED